MKRLPTWFEILGLAWPIILANMATPLLGLTDTAVIGNVGTAVDLGAIALGSVVFSFVFWTFSFLRMGTTGFVAQADGANDELEIRLSLGRALILAGLIGVAILGLQLPITWLMFPLFDASEAVDAVAKDYFFIRIWGAPASLSNFALMGLLIGLGKSRHLLALQLLLNGLNIALDVFLGGVLKWGVVGIAWGTVFSEWIVSLVSLAIILRMLKQRHRHQSQPTPFWTWKRLRESQQLLATISANRDILLRTLFLLIGFGWFTRQGAQFGDELLAANHILLQLIFFSAFFLDGFAYVTESMIGKAVGRKDLAEFNHVFRRTTELSALTALAIAVLVAIPGAWAIQALSEQKAVVNLALDYRFLTAVYVFLSFAAYQLDGVFIGATKGPEMRNASAISLIIFLIAWWLGKESGNAGLWVAFTIYVVARAVTLAVQIPKLRASISAN
ncbi:MAG: MATE family efflux transporter [Verrucomicrobiota bacterium]